MTIAVAVRTSTAVVFAADSKLTTRALEGMDKKNKLIWVDQTYDNATKVAHDRNRRLMVMVAGAGSIGDMPATDYIATKEFPDCISEEEQNGALFFLILGMVERRRAFWVPRNVDPSHWLGTTLFLALPSPERHVPRTWRVELEGDDAVVVEVLREGGVELEGAYAEAFGLIYGYEPKVFRSIVRALRIKEGRLAKAMSKRKELSPIHKVNFWVMPVQDAIDFAVFLAEVQVQMDRFLPGTPACGGPIDVLALQMSPQPGIITYPGKFVHHPRPPAPA